MSLFSSKQIWILENLLCLCTLYEYKLVVS
jgi:hypothetical protein